MISVHFGRSASNVSLANKPEQNAANRTSRIICKEELWVP